MYVYIFFIRTRVQANEQLTKVNVTKVLTARLLYTQILYIFVDDNCRMPIHKQVVFHS